MSAICEGPSLLVSCSEGANDCLRSKEFYFDCFSLSTFLNILGDPEAGKSLLCISIVLLASLLCWTTMALLLTADCYVGAGFGLFRYFLSALSTLGEMFRGDFSYSFERSLTLLMF